MKQYISKCTKFLALILAFLAISPQVEAGVPYPNNLYLTQHTDVTCTLVSNVMMLRARMFLANRSDWGSLTEESVAPTAWINGAGQRTAYTYYLGDGSYMSVNQAYVNGLTVASLQQILNAHPEGVCIYVTSIPHAQWVTDIENGVVYSGDSSCAAYFGRRPLANTLQGQCCGYNQNSVLANVTSYWYISSTNLSVQVSTNQTVKAARSVPNGKYRIACASHSEYGLNVAGGSHDNEANVHLWKYTEGAGESEFELTWNGEFYNIKASHSGKNLDLFQARSANGTNVQQYEIDGTDVQKWTLKEVGDGSFYIINYNGLYMDVKDGVFQNATNIQGWEGNQSAAQKWVLIPVDRQHELPDGDYRIALGKNITYGLDVAAGEKRQEANIQLYKAWDPGTADAEAQTWTVRHVGNGYYSITLRGTNLALNVTGAAYTGKPNIQLWNYTDGDVASTWMLKEAGDGSFYVVSKTGQFLDLFQGTVADHTNIQGYSGNSSDAQKWKFIAVNGQQTIDDGVYKILSAKDRSFGLDVEGVSTNDEANVHLWTIGNGENQKWIVKYIGNGYYSIVSCNSKKALDVYQAGSSRGANIQQYRNGSDSGNAAQQWIIRQVDNDQYNIINRNGLFVDVFGGTMATGTNIQGWYGNGTIAQRWIFSPTEYDQTAPTISDIQISDITSAGYRVTCTVADNVGVTSVKMPSWTINNNQDDILWHNATLSGNKATYYVKTADHNNETGAYLTHIYAYDKAGNTSSASAGTINVPVETPDTKGPEITNVIFSEITPDGFRVTCRVTDETYVKSVKMATWTVKDGQDDLVWHEAQIATNGNYATVYIKTSEHKNEFGDYNIHIYAWDKNDNQHAINAGKVDVPVTNGLYRIASAINNNYVIDVRGGATENGTNVQLWSIDTSVPQQKFLFEYVGNGYYFIIDSKSRKALDVHNASPQSGTNIQIWEKSDNNSAQLWRIVKNSNGTYTLISKVGTVLDLDGAITENGRNIQAYDRNKTPAQNWVLTRIADDAPIATGNRYETYQGGRGGSGNVVAVGIDVSEHQGAGFNFQAMKDRGVNFVILRCGWVGRKDYRFDEYYAAAKAAGLDVGAYFYSYAENTAEALQEANVCLQQIAGKQFEYPIYFDFEDNTYQGYLNSAQSRDICLTFLNRVASQGYLVGLYGMASWIDEDWGGKVPTATVCQKYECWIANYTSNVEGYKNIYKTRYGMFQYSDGGTTAPTTGFGVDSNYCFKDYPTIVREHHFNGY